MIPVKASPAEGVAHQFTADSAGALAGLRIPTGEVTVQHEDPMNSIEALCYVPTAWGSAVLTYGQWFVVYDNGAVIAYTETQFNALFESAIVDPPTAPVEEPEFRAMPTMSPFSRASTLSVELLESGEMPVAVFEAESLPTVPRWLEALDAVATQHRFDWVATYAEMPKLITVSAVATGAVLATFSMSARVFVFSDGRIEVKRP